MIRKLCYGHHIVEFNALPNGRRWEAASWITVHEDCCEECEALRLLAELEADTDTLPCGHPRSAATGDVTRWCSECEKEARE